MRDSAEKGGWGEIIITDNTDTNMYFRAIRLGKDESAGGGGGG